MARKKKFNQRELYEATAQLMLEIGYDRFSFQLLADKLHVTRTALYKYYKNKDDLLNAYLNNSLKEVLERLDNMDWSMDYKDKLQLLMDIVFDYADTHKISSMVPNQMWTKENEMDSSIQQSKAFHIQFFSFIQQLIEEGQHKGVLKKDIPPEIIIETIFHSINLPNRAGLPLDKRAFYIKRMLFEGILV